MKQKLYTSTRGLKFLWPALLLVVLGATAPAFSPLVTTEVDFVDNDHDGYPTPQDCDDANPQVHPAALEICNSIDDNCNGQVDEPCRIYYQDSDLDRYGRADRWIIYHMTPRIGYALVAGDCDDSNSWANPGMAENCGSPFDDNCDGVINEGCSIFYHDSDGDGWGHPLHTIVGTAPPAGFVSLGGDCDDSNPDINPGMPEAPDGIDNNCDGLVDVAGTYYRDADGDGYGDVNVSITATSLPNGYVINSIDCNDYDPAIHPIAAETCNFKDDDCDGQVDEGCQVFYQDLDADRYGLWHIQVRALTQPAGYTNMGGDCDDGTHAIHPGAIEVCNFRDDNCNGQVDEGCQVFYLDADNDGFGLWHMQKRATSRPSGYSTIGGDCDDANPNSHPGATEICNGINDDCDALTDEGCPSPSANMRAEQKEALNIVDLNITASPNPTSNIFTLRLEGDRKNGKVTLRIMSQFGEIKETKNNLQIGQNIRLGSGYPTGIYFIEATQGRNKRVIKVVKS